MTDKASLNHGPEGGELLKHSASRLGWKQWGFLGGFFISSQLPGFFFVNSRRWPLYLRLDTDFVGE